jgi:xylulokinase
VSGKVCGSAAAVTGLREGTPVVGGGGDQAAGAVGNGIVKTGLISSTIGTSGVIFAYLDKISIDPKGRTQTFCHAVPDKWHVMGVTQAAGFSLKWFRDILCKDEISVAELMDVDPYVLMDQEAEKVRPGSNGLIYLPYLIGERAPHLDSDARGVFFGLSTVHTKRDMIRSVMEGVVYSLRDCLEIIKGLGAEINEIRASGGGGKSRLWKQMQADIFGTPITTINSSEGPALGVALLAGVGTGIYKDVAEACDTAIKIKEVQQPDMELNKKYMEFYKLYGQLYRSLRNDFKDLAGIMSRVYGDDV